MLLGGVVVTAMILLGATVGGGMLASRGIKGEGPQAAMHIDVRLQRAGREMFAGTQHCACDPSAPQCSADMEAYEESTTRLQGRPRPHDPTPALRQGSASRPEI